MRREPHLSPGDPNAIYLVAPGVVPYLVFGWCLRIRRCLRLRSVSLYFWLPYLVFRGQGHRLTSREEPYSTPDCRFGRARLRDYTWEMFSPLKSACLTRDTSLSLGWEPRSDGTTSDWSLSPVRCIWSIYWRKA